MVLDSLQVLPASFWPALTAPSLSLSYPATLARAADYKLILKIKNVSFLIGFISIAIVLFIFYVTWK